MRSSKKLMPQAAMVVAYFIDSPGIFSCCCCCC